MRRAGWYIKDTSSRGRKMLSGPYGSEEQARDAIYKNSTRLNHPEVIQLPRDRDIAGKRHRLDIQRGEGTDAAAGNFQRSFR